MEGIDVTVDNVGSLRDIALMRVSGFVDTTTSTELQQRLFQLIQNGYSHFIVDLADVQYVSSAGWGVFVGEIRGLREKSGDLKIIHMTPEVYEVFEMLEFNRILSSYESLEEAVDDFDFCRGLDLTQSGLINQESGIGATVKQIARPVPKNNSSSGSIPTPQQYPKHTRMVNDSELPLNEKIKKLVVENPRLGVWGIKRSLYSPRFGYTRVGLLKLRNQMKRLGLETRARRYRFYRSR